MMRRENRIVNSKINFKRPYNKKEIWDNKHARCLLSPSLSYLQQPGRKGKAPTRLSISRVQINRAAIILVTWLDASQRQMWRCFHTECRSQVANRQHISSRTAYVWLCCIPANHTPEMIDPFLVPPADVILEGSPSFPWPAVPGFPTGNRPPGFYNKNVPRCVYYLTAKNLEGDAASRVGMCPPARVRVAKKTARHFRHMVDTQLPVGCLRDMHACMLRLVHYPTCVRCAHPHTHTTPFSESHMGAQRCHGLTTHGKWRNTPTPTSCLWRMFRGDKDTLGWQGAV